MHVKSAQSVNHELFMIQTHGFDPVWQSRFGFKKKIGSLCEGSIPVIFTSMVVPDKKL